MKSPGTIYRRYRRMRRKALYDFMVESRSKLHKNCHYGKTILLQDNGVLRLCTYEKESFDQIEVCTNPGDCNAFACVWSKEKALEQFNNELRDYEIKSQKYPDLTLLEWVLDKDLTDAIREPNWIGKIAIYVISLMERLLKMSAQKDKTID